MAWPNSQARRVALVIQNAQVSGSGTHSALPVLITRANLPDEICSPTDGNRAQSDGGDIRAATGNDGTGQLAIEIVNWEYDTSDGAGDADIEIWVKLDVNTASDTTFYLAYNTAGTTSADGVTDTYGRNAVWSGYADVYHLQGTGAQVSSTGSGNDLTAYNSPTDAQGPFGNASGALSFNGSDQKLLSAAAPFTGNQGTISAWARPDDTVGVESIAGISFNSSPSNIFRIAKNGDKPRAQYRGDAGITADTVDGSSSMSTSVFTYLVNRCDPASDVEIFYNGASEGTDTHAAVSGDDFNQTEIGVLERNAASQFWNGDVDEVRYTASLLSDDWIATEYANQNSPATFIVEGTPEDVGGGAIEATGTPQAQAATIAGTAGRTAKASGALGAQASVIAGNALRGAYAEAIIEAQLAAIVASASAGSSSYQPNGVEFDGTNDWLSRGADLTGNADSKLCTGSFWVNFANAAVVDFLELIWATGSGNLRFEIRRTGDEEISIRGKNASGTTILSISTSAASVADTDWHHVMFSFDMADTGKRHLYLDDASDLNVATYTDGTIDFTQSEHEVGGIDVGGLTFALNGCLAQFWLDPGTYIDLSVAANRRKFVGAGATTSVDMGSDGSTPTGTSPLVFFDGETSSWHTNKGTGGGFTENGELTDCATDPPAALSNPYAFGAPQAQAAAVSASASRTAKVSGTPQAQGSSITGVASREVFASGTPQAQASEVTGNSNVGPDITAEGALVAQDSAVAGTSVRTAKASGSPKAQDSVVSGIVERVITATGALQSGASTVAGVASIFVQGIASGTLKAGAAVVVGATSRTAKASGAVQSGASMVAGAVTRALTATGALVSGAARIVGFINTGTEEITDTTNIQLPVDYQMSGHPQGETQKLSGSKATRLARKLGKALKF